MTVLSASYASTASYVLNAVTASYVTTAQTASYVLQAVSSSYALTASYAANVPVTASYALTASYVLNAVSASYATTASFATNFTASNVLVTGTITAQTLNVQYVTASTEYSSGSNVFGNSLSNTQQLTGSVGITGSLTLFGNEVISGSSSALYGYTGSLLGTASTASYVTTAQTASYVLTAQTASYVLVAQTASYVTLAQTASYVTTAQTASYVLQAVSASYATQAANASTASYVVNAISASYAATASSATTFTIGGATMYYATATNPGSSTTGVHQTATGSFTSAFYNYTLSSVGAASARTGQILAVWSGSTIQYTDNSTIDIGNTSVATNTVTLSGGQVALSLVVSNATAWTIKTSITYI